MKKITKYIIAAAIILIASNSFAQKFYVKLNGGYNFVSAAEAKYNTITTGTLTVYEKTLFSLGKGTSFGGAFGYLFNKFVGTELDVSYLIGATSTMDDISVNPYRFRWSSTFIRFVPTVIITPGFDKINPYAKLGLILGTGTYTAKQSTNSSNATLLYNGGLAIGFNSSFGVNYKINKNISILCELSIISLSYGATRSELIERTENGVDMLPTLSTRFKITEYSDSHTSDASSIPDENLPRKGSIENVPFSSVGFNIGLQYHF
ncbi:MAG: outer membrane beta-barrel protein [Bacteroidia bacterium]